MRKLTEEDLSKIIGSTIKGYRVEAARIKQGPFIDSDHYGFILGNNSNCQYVTWEFHLTEDESVSVYWGHYIADRDEALRDFDTRSMGPSQWFDVTITETLQLTVRVEAHSPSEAEQIVTDDWKRSEYILGPENFAGVEFQATTTTDEQDNGSDLMGAVNGCSLEALPTSISKQGW